MSADDYEENRLHRANMAEEMARFHHAEYERLAPKYGLEVKSWGELTEPEQALFQAVMLELVDKRIIFPASVVSRLQMEIGGIKDAWQTFNRIVGGG